MNAVKNNPYRTLGLFGNSTEKELQKQIATIKRFAEVGKTKAFDYDFPFFGEVVRSTEKVQEAASKIEQAKNKVHYALFWFLNSGHIDEAALNNLKDGHIEKATEIWEKTLKDSTVTVKNFAAISNLSTLQLGIVTYNGSFDPEKFTASIELKGKLIMSDACDSFIKTVIGEGISINRETILKEFADEVMQIIKPYLNKPNGIKSSQLISAFNSFPNEIRQYVSGKFTDRPINNIENQIEKTKQKRDDNPNDAEEYGEELYKNTKEDLVFLKNVWGANNVQYQMIANKLANEILQCAIEFFNELQGNNDFDPGESAMKVMKMAKAINPTGQTKSRLDENIENVQEWINDSEERNRHSKIKEDLEFVASKLQRFQNIPDTISNAKDLVVSCKPKLINIKTALGSTDDFYSKLSSAVVNNALNALISVVNEAQNGLQYDRTKLFTLPTTISSALEVINLMSGMDMVYELRNRFNQNKTTISNIQSQLNQVANRQSSSSSSSGGCYIATMAYGSYEHPQVIELRKFRDNTLSKTAFGRGFIRIYYKYSPKLVELLKDKHLVNQSIKSVLNTLIRIIK
ncbi:MAG: hypothetical protein NTV75_02485 [Bacteroidia bacterium]|nr:hypothetical protein [Bacteroidia bacterium]